MLQTEIITDTAGFARIAPDWRRLEQSEGLLGLFLGFSWQFEWWRALGGGRQLRILVARDGGEVVGILPLFEEQKVGLRQLAFIGSAGGGSDYLDVPCREREVRAHLLREAAAMDADLLELGDLESHSPTVALAQSQAQAADRFAELLPRYPCPYIPIRTSFAEYMEGVGRRENLRRRAKWFAAQPGFRIACETSPDAVAPFLARFYRLHAARWLEDGGSQAFADPRLVSFHQHITARFADEGRLRLWTMWVAGEAVAVAYTFDEQNRSLYYQSGFLPAWGSRSAGLVLFARYVEDAFERGLREVDLLRGAEPYKAEWTKEARATVTFRTALTARGRAALLLEKARLGARTAARSALPNAVRVRVAQAVRGARLRNAAV